jgi:competence protein ComEC
MFELKTGYIAMGLVIGLILLFSFLTTLPDGRLHIVFCNVGQGDAAYIRFPDGRDMLMDGGPDNSVVQCLGRHIPFWDRTIDIIALSHPQNDHLAGLLSVLPRYRVRYFVHSQVGNATAGFDTLMKLVRERHVAEKLVTTGDRISLGLTSVSVIWPTKSQIAAMKLSGSNVLGAQTDANVNDASVVLHLRYGTFDALFTGDADQDVDPTIVSQVSDIPDGLEVLKVPHHGAKTGMTDEFLHWLYPTVYKANYNQQSVGNNSNQPALRSFTTKSPLAVISVGKNSFGHPAPETISRLTVKGIQVLRTDESGDIEVVSDGKSWSVRTAGITPVNPSAGSGKTKNIPK